MTNWRPGDWKNPYSTLPTGTFIDLNHATCESIRKCKEPAYEQGADAMFSALVKYLDEPCGYYYEGNPTLQSPDGIYYYEHRKDRTECWKELLEAKDGKQ